MRMRRGCKQIRLVYQRSFRRPVKIRVEPEPPRSADRIVPLFPAGTFPLIRERLVPMPRPALRVVRREALPQPDWRIVGDHELMLQEGSEAA
jgi:hypothetical protein